MFKKFALLAMVFVLLAGCATKQDNNVRNGSVTATEELAKLPYTFAVIYGENGAYKVFTPEESAEKYANIETLFIEPGLIVIIDSEAKMSGMDTKLEEIFKKEGFNLEGTKEHKARDGKEFLQMNFAKNGEMVLFN